MLIKLLKKCEMMTHPEPLPPPHPYSNLPAGWRNVYWLELKKKLVVSIIVCKHRSLKASSELSSAATHMLYIQFILESRLGERCVYSSRVAQPMAAGPAPGSPERHCAQLSGGPLWCFLRQSSKRETKASSPESKLFLLLAEALCHLFSNNFF